MKIIIETNSKLKGYDLIDIENHDKLFYQLPQLLIVPKVQGNHYNSLVILV